MMTLDKYLAEARKVREEMTSHPNIPEVERVPSEEKIDNPSEPSSTATSQAFLPSISQNNLGSTARLAPSSPKQRRMSSLPNLKFHQERRDEIRSFLLHPPPEFYRKKSEDHYEKLIRPEPPVLNQAQQSRVLRAKYSKMNFATTGGWNYH
jgi:hypothetical protein